MGTPLVVESISSQRAGFVNQACPPNFRFKANAEQVHQSKIYGLYCLIYDPLFFFILFLTSFIKMDARTVNKILAMGSDNFIYFNMNGSAFE